MCQKGLLHYFDVCNVAVGIDVLGGRVYMPTYMYSVVSVVKLASLRVHVYMRFQPDVDEEAIKMLNNSPQI